MLRLAALTLSLAACGRASFDAVPDGALVNDGDVDAAPLLPFGTPVWLDTISNTGDDDPTLTADGLEIVFESVRAGGAGGADLYWSQRASVGVPFAPPTRLASLCTANDEEHPGLSPDGLTLYFTSDRPGGEGSYDIWVTTRAARGSTAWAMPMQVPELSDAGNNEGTQIADDNVTMVLANGPNASGEDIYITTRAGPASPWAAPELVDAVDVNVANVTDGGPALSGDLLALYFSSGRASTNQQIFRAVRPSLTEPFGPAVQLTELFANGASDPWITADERRMVFVSQSRLYEAVRP